MNGLLSPIGTQIGELVIHPMISEDGIVFKTIDDEMMPKIYKEYIYSKLIEIILNNKKNTL